MEGKQNLLDMLSLFTLQVGLLSLSADGKPIPDIVPDDDFTDEYFYWQNLGSLWEQGEHHEGDIIEYIPQNSGSRRKRSILKREVSYWKDAIVPIEIKRETFDSDENEIISRAIKAIEAETCIRFPKRRKKDKSYIEVRGDLGKGECWSYLGHQGGNQTLSLGKGCVRYHYVLHELLHVLGLVHQHSSPDRDRYINVHWENIDPTSKFAHWFDKYDWTEFEDLGVSYDYYSVMHYSAYVGSRNGKPTISSRNKKVKIEERTKLSEKDILKLNIVYCTEHIGINADGTNYYLFYDKNVRLKY